MKDYEIRRFQPGDEDRINGFFDALGFEARMFFNRLDGNRQGALSYPQDDPEKCVRWMACDREKMVGYVFLWDLDTTVPWFGIAVADEAKGVGLGRKLAEMAIQYAREKGKGGVLLTTHIANFRAQALYEKCGFRQIGTAPSGELLYLLRF